MLGPLQQLTVIALRNTRVTSDDVIAIVGNRPSLAELTIARAPSLTSFAFVRHLPPSVRLLRISRCGPVDISARWSVPLDLMGPFVYQGSEFDHLTWWAQDTAAYEPGTRSLIVHKSFSKDPTVEQSASVANVYYRFATLEPYGH